MHVHQGELADVTRFLENAKSRGLDHMEPHFESNMRIIRKFKKVDERIRMLEVGTGTGWFPILCRKKGLHCRGLEISLQLVEHARALGRAVGAEPEIVLGNIEEADVADSEYDVVVASSVFEHVEKWRPALGRIHKALKPGGVLLFASTNKYSVMSGEFGMPFYGWLPDAARFWLRKKWHGPDIMKLGIDFHQFTYPQLRRAFEATGFAEVYDRVELADPAEVESPLKRAVLKLCKRSRLAKGIALTFADMTIFACIK